MAKFFLTTKANNLMYFNQLSGIFPVNKQNKKKKTKKKHTP